MPPPRDGSNCPAATTAATSCGIRVNAVAPLGSSSVTWFEASGRGTVYSCTVTRRIGGSWRAATPFVLAYVELEEGPRVLTNIVGCDPETVHIGQAVQAVFDRTPDGPALLRFTPA